MKATIGIFLGILFTLNINTVKADGNPRFEGEDTTCVDVFDITSEYWNNDILYPYADDNIPDTIQLRLTDNSRCFVMPVETRINSQFGWRWNRPHKGLDLHLQTGDPVKAAFDGVVRYAQYNNGGYGNLVIIRHYNGLETYYAHLSKINVQPNETIKAGDILGEGGCTGSRCTGPHLHFETRYKDKPFNPLSIIAFEKGCLSSETVLLTKDNFVFAKSSTTTTANNTANLNSTTNNLSKSNKNITVAKNNNLNKLKYSYKIKSGDSLLAIALKNKTSVNALCKLNKLTPESTLKIGKVLRLR